LQSRNSREVADCNAICGPRAVPGPGSTGTRPAPLPNMLDVLLVLGTAAFFGLSWGYTLLCEKL
jgi:hypothetical protein